MKITIPAPLRHALMTKSATTSNTAVWSSREDHTKIAYLLIFQTRLNAACRCSQILTLFCGHKNRFISPMTRNDRVRMKFRSFQTHPKKARKLLWLWVAGFWGVGHSALPENSCIWDSSPLEVSVACGKQQSPGAHLTPRPSLTTSQI